MYVSSHPVMTPPASAGSPSSCDSTESGLSPIEGMFLSLQDYIELTFIGPLFTYM